jgi:hypothetical protein
MLRCPKCNGELWKNGSGSNGKKKYKCSECLENVYDPVVIIENSNVSVEHLDKKNGSFDWREWTDELSDIQKLHEKASFSQDVATIKIDTKYKSLIILPLADLHIGSISTNYEAFRNFTDFILKHDNVYVMLVGDLTDNFGTFKNALAVLQQIISPEKQEQFIESWLDEIAHKILVTGWDNHSSFDEKFTGKNSIKKLLSRNFVYFNGIGVANISLNGVNYKLAMTHRTRGFSSFNKTHGLKRLAREDIPDADIYVSAHVHTPAMETTGERGLIQTFIVTGSIKNDGYAKRYFSYNHYEYFPCFVISSETKHVLPFFYMEDAIKFSNGLELS